MKNNWAERWDNEQDKRYAYGENSVDSSKENVSNEHKLNETLARKTASLFISTKIAGNLRRMEGARNLHESNSDLAQKIGLKKPNEMRIRNEYNALRQRIAKGCANCALADICVFAKDSESAPDALAKQLLQSRTRRKIFKKSIVETQDSNSVFFDMDAQCIDRMSLDKRKNPEKNNFYKISELENEQEDRNIKNNIEDMELITKDNIYSEDSSHKFEEIDDPRTWEYDEI